MTLRSAIAVLLIGLLAACGRDDFRGANVVVVGIDTLRADHVGAYGYPRPTTPRIDAFAQEAVRFQTAVSASSWTTPSFASMFTGLVPSAHGGGDGKCPDVTVLSAAHPTLATQLRAAGYRTASFVSNVWVGAEIGLARGFADHERLMFSEQAVDGAIAWLRKKPEGPFFLFVHIMDPHQPWIPLPEDAALFLDPAYRGTIGTGFAGEPKPDWDAADRRRAVDLYDGEIRFADRLTGRILDVLDELGLDDRTIVVVTSDHGEEFFEHGKMGHGYTLYDEVLLVPFLVRFPNGRRPGVVTQPVRTMDLFPTLLDAVGHPIPGGLDGVSLMPLVRGEPAPKTDVALSEYPCFATDTRLQSLRTAQEKLLFSPATKRETLYDLAADPREQTDVAAAHPERVALLRQVLAAESEPIPEGFHMLARGGPKGNVLRVRLEAASKFHDVALAQVERGDRYRLTHDDTVLDLKLRLPSRELPARRPDTDGVIFRTGADQPFAVRRLSLDGTPMPLAQVWVGDAGRAAPALPLELGTTTPGIAGFPRMAPTGPLDARPRVQISLVRHVAAEKAVLTPEMEERLRAMGYIQ